MKKLLIFTSMALLLFGCGEKKTDAKKEVKQEQIKLYISGPEAMVKTLEMEFEKEHGNVINLYHTTSGPLKQKIWTEMEAGKIQADVVFGSDPLMYLALEEKNVLKEYVSKEYKNLKKEYQLKTKCFSLVNARYGVIIYNKKNIVKNDVPKKWEDLKDKKWQGKIVAADPTQSSTALALNSGLMQLKKGDFDYHKALKENKISYIKKNISVASRVETGEFDIGFLPHDGVLRILKKSKSKGLESPLAIAWPEEGAISIQRPVAIIKNQKRSKEATKISQKFVDFLLSEKGQQIMSKFYFISVRKNLETNVVPKNIKSVVVDWEHINEKGKEIRKGFKKNIFEK